MKLTDWRWVPKKVSTVSINESKLQRHIACFASFDYPWFHFISEVRVLDQIEESFNNKTDLLVKWSMRTWSMRTGGK